MKASIAKVKSALKSMWADEAAQGMTEYILLVVVVVGLGMIFKGKIMEIVKGKMDDIGKDVGNFSSSN